jgi:hypothetical protein
VSIFGKDFLSWGRKGRIGEGPDGHSDQAGLAMREPVNSAATVRAEVKRDVVSAV